MESYPKTELYQYFQKNLQAITKSKIWFLGYTSLFFSYVPKRGSLFFKLFFQDTLVYFLVI